MKNINFLQLYSFLEKIRYEFQKRIKIDSNVHICINKKGELEFIFLVTFNRKFYESTKIFSRSELIKSNTNLYNLFIYFVEEASNKIKARIIETELEKKKSKKDNKG